MANQNFRVKNGLEVGGVEIANSSGAINTASFPASGVTAGTTGNSTTIPVITVDAQGLVTNLQTASVSGVDSFTYTEANTTFVLATGDGSSYAQTIPSANSTVFGVVKSSTTIPANTQGVLNLEDGVITPATSGNSTAIPVITVDTHGRVTSLSTASVSGVSNFVYTDANATFTLSTGDGSTYDASIGFANSTVAGLITVGTLLGINAGALFVDQDSINHDGLTNFVADEHVAHSTINITAGDGLTGGGTIEANVSIGINAGAGLEANSTSLDVRANTGIVANSTGVFVDEGNVDIHNLSGYVANEHIDHSTVTLTAGNGLTGGGDITASRSFAVGAGNGIGVNSTAVSVVAGTGVVSNATGVHIGQAVGISDSVTFGNITVTGNLTIQGTETLIDTNSLVVNDAIITVASGQSGTPTLDAGITVERGDLANATLFWDESLDRWGHRLAGGTEYVIHTSSHDVELGTHTSGNYVATLTAGDGISGDSAQEGGTPTVAVVANTGIVANSSGVFTNDSQIIHDNLSGYVANEHIDHSTVSITAGNGLSGGGTIAATRTVAVKANTGITANSSGVFTDDGSIVHDNLSGFVANEHIDHSGVSITAGNGLSGGGTIDSTRTLAVNAGTGLVANSTGVHTVDSEIIHDNLSGFVANEHIDHSVVTLTAGNGLTGGGDITTARSFAVVGGTGVTSNATGVHIGQAVGTTDSVTFANTTISSNLIDGSARVLKIYNEAGTVVWG